MEVLLVDHVPDSCSLFQKALEKVGFDVVYESDIDRASSYLENGQIKIAVIHHDQPFVDGLGFLNRFASQSANSSAHIILLAENWESDELVVALECGASDFLTLPIKPDELVAKVNVGKRQVELRCQLAMAQKLESIGQLAAGVAHEINTPVQYVGDNLQFIADSIDQLVNWIKEYETLISRVDRGETFQDQMDQVIRIRKEIDWDFLQQELPLALRQSLQGVHQVGRIVGAMKGYSHMGRQDFQLVDLREIVSNAKEVARNQWKYHCDVEVQWPESWPLIPCLPGELSQVFLNLLLNAAHAIEELSLPDGRKGIIRFVGKLSENQVLVEVQDTGMGIPKGIQSKVFDPFFTTKEVGKGTGQGLVMVHNIVKQHGGEISFESYEGLGTTFFVQLPLTQTEQECELITERPMDREPA